MTTPPIKITGGTNFGIGSPGSVNAQHLTGPVHVSAGAARAMPDEFAQGLERFTAEVNRLLEQNGVPAEQAGAVREPVEALAEVVADLEPGEAPDYEKRLAVESRLARVAGALAKLLPEGVELAATFTPLAPFGKLIGKAVDEVVRAVQRAPAS